MSSQKYNFDSLINQLKDRQDVTFITPADVNYAEARLVYNRMHDFHPGLIVRSLNIDVLRTVMDYAFTNNIVLAIRGGGHHIGGFGTCDDGIVIDFSPFKNIHIDVENKLVTVAPGVKLADIDRELCKAGYVIPCGTVSDTGLAGLTLGGGIGWLIGTYGLTCDQLAGADVLLADGRHVRAEDPEHQDLLWALRGGGGNFGIVTAFRYHLLKLPETICGVGMVAQERAIEVLNILSNYFQNDCPASMTLAPIFIKNNANEIKLRIDFCCANGSEADLQQLLNLSSHITWSDVKPWYFPDWQKAFDHLMLPPKRGYWKAAYLDNLSPTIIDVVSAAFSQAPANADCTIMIEQLHGAFKHYSQADAAFPLRHTSIGILISARWLDKANDATSINWVRNSFNEIDPKEQSGTYLNYTNADDKRAVQTLLSSTESRIANVKACYDPNNRFTRNHNVAPNKLNQNEAA